MGLPFFGARTRIRTADDTRAADRARSLAAFNEIYVTYFPQKPARTTFAAEALARGAKIEIEVIAVKN